MATKKRIMDIIGLVSICIVALCFISLMIMSFLITRRYNTTEYYELLTNYAYHKVIYSVESIISIVNSIFIIPATIGVFINLYSKMKENVRNWLIIPTAATIIGSLLLISLIIVKLLLIFKTAPIYVTAIGDTKIAILEFFENRVGYISIFQVIAYLLLFTIGTGIFGVLSFKYQLTKETSIWLAIFTAFLGLGQFGVFMPDNIGSVFIFLASIASILYFFWLGSIIFVIRQNMKEDKFTKVELPEKLVG